MKNKITGIIIAAAVSMTLLTSCGGGNYTFSDPELTNSFGIKKEYFDKLDVQPDDDGETGNDMFEQAKALGGADFYTYWLPQDDSDERFDVVQLYFYGGRVCSVTLGSFGTDDSKHTVIGVKTGMDRASAVKICSEYFGEEGDTLSDDKQMWGLTEQKYDRVYFGSGSSKKGMLTLMIDYQTDEVVQIEYMKN